MKIYTLVGRVLPNFPKRIIQTDTPSINPSKKGSLSFEIINSLITAKITEDHIENPETVLKSVESVIQGSLDAYSFILGDIYEAKIELLIENGEEKVYVEKTIKDLLPDVPTQEIPSIEDLMKISLEYISFRFALSNFKNAKRYPAYTGFFVYLAIENAKKHLFPIDLDKESEEWEGLRQKLSLSREDIDFAKRFADLVRHGKYQDVSGVDNTKILMTGADVILKFYNYLTK